MMTKHLKSSKGRWFRYLSVLIVLFILSPCSLCYTLRDQFPFSYLHLFAFGKYYADKAEGLIPEYDKLNDKVIKNLPLPADAILLTETLVRGGPGYNGLLDPHYDPRYLSICYATNENNIEGFYKFALSNADWKLVYDNLGEFYVKDNACIIVLEKCHRGPFDQVVQPGYTTVYEVEVYHNLNTLLGFPGIPDGGCP